MEFTLLYQFVLHVFVVGTCTNDIFSSRLEIGKISRVEMKTKINSTRFFIIVTVYNQPRTTVLYLCLMILDPFSVKTFHKSIEKFSSTVTSFFTVARKEGRGRFSDSFDKLISCQQYDSDGWTSCSSCVLVVKKVPFWEQKNPHSFFFHWELNSILFERPYSIGSYSYLILSCKSEVIAAYQ